MRHWIYIFILGVLIWSGCANAVLKGHYHAELKSATAALLKSAPKLTNGSISLAQANRLFQQQKFQQSLQANLPWAKAGSVQARLEIGFLYEFGRGVKANGQLAALWYYSAIRPSPYNRRPMERGVRYYFGLDGHKKEYFTAARWFRMAAELGDDRY